MRVLQFQTLVEPAEEPVSLEEAKLQLRINGFSDDTNISDHPDDPVILTMISAAREHAERFTGLMLARRTVIGIADGFPECRRALSLNTGPVISVEDLSYYADGVLTPMSLSELYVDTLSIPATIALPSGVSWPTPDVRPGALRVELDAGYLAAADSELPDARVIPPGIKQAILLMLSHLYENREAVGDKAFALLPLGYESFLRRHRIRLGLGNA